MGTSFQRVSYSFMEKGMEIAVNTAAAANNSQLTAVIDSMGMLAEAEKYNVFCRSSKHSG